MTSFVAGDLVALKSSKNTPMTIKEINNNVAVCCWLNVAKKEETSSFPCAMLVPYQDPLSNYQGGGTAITS